MIACLAGVSLKFEINLAVAGGAGTEECTSTKPKAVAATATSFGRRWYKQLELTQAALLHFDKLSKCLVQAAKKAG